VALQTPSLSGFRAKQFFIPKVRKSTVLTRYLYVSARFTGGLRTLAAQGWSEKLL
jgi:hypothetical protein